MQIFNSILPVQNSPIRNYQKNISNQHNSAMNASPSFGSIFSVKKPEIVGVNKIKEVLDACVKKFLSTGEEVILTMDTKGGGHVACPKDLDLKVADTFLEVMGKDSKHITSIDYDIFDPNNKMVPRPYVMI